MEKLVQFKNAVVFIIGCVALFTLNLLFMNTSDIYSEKSDGFHLKKITRYNGQFTQGNLSCYQGVPCLPSIAESVHKKQAYPNTIIIGVKKCGTRALLSILGSHPQVSHLGAEAHYFDYEQNYNLGDNWYKSRMPFEPKKIIMEKSPNYAFSELTPERLRAFNPETKLILLIRNPVKRFISEFTQVKSKNSKADYRKNFFTHDNELRTDQEAVQRGNYAGMLRKWHDFIRRKRLLIVNGDQFIEDPLPILQSLEKFLDVKPYFDTQNIVFDKEKGFYCFKSSDRRYPSCLSASKGRKPYKMDLKHLKKLHNFYEPLNDELIQYFTENLQTNTINLQHLNTTLRREFYL